MAVIQLNDYDQSNKISLSSQFKQSNAAGFAALISQQSSHVTLLRFKQWL